MKDFWDYKWRKKKNKTIYHIRKSPQGWLIVLWDKIVEKYRTYEDLLDFFNDYEIPKQTDND